jgi:hypothetical protein
MSAPLYNRDILALAVATAEYLPNPDARFRVSKRAPLCGSAIILDLDTDDTGRDRAIDDALEAHVRTTNADLASFETVKQWRIIDPPRSSPAT